MAGGALSAPAESLTPYQARASIPLDGAGDCGVSGDGPGKWGFVMGSVFGRALAVAGALAVVFGSATGAAAKPRPPVLAFTPSPYNYGRIATGQTASQTFTLANSGRGATAG